MLKCFTAGGAALRIQAQQFLQQIHSISIQITADLGQVLGSPLREGKFEISHL